jgi:hypothetical protein
MFSEFARTARNGDLTKVKRLLREGVASVNEVNRNCLSALPLALNITLNSRPLDGSWSTEGPTFLSQSVAAPFGMHLLIPLIAAQKRLDFCVYCCCGAILLPTSSQDARLQMHSWCKREHSCVRGSRRTSYSGGRALLDAHCPRAVTPLDSPGQRLRGAHHRGALGNRPR